MENFLNYYQVLGVSYYATTEEIKEAYRNKVKEVHPDRETGDAELFKIVKEAYDVLQNDEKRKRYDEILFKSININVVSNIGRNQKEPPKNDEVRTSKPKGKSKRKTWFPITSLILNFALIIIIIGGYTHFKKELDTTSSDSQTLDSRLTEVIKENTQLNGTVENLKDVNNQLSSTNDELQSRVADLINKNQTQAVATINADENDSYFTIGSSEEHVRKVMGTPTAITFLGWQYDLSRIEFDSAGKVTGYRNTSNNLKVK